MEKGPWRETHGGRDLEGDTLRNRLGTRHFEEGLGRRHLEGGRVLEGNTWRKGHGGRHWRRKKGRKVRQSWTIYTLLLHVVSVLSSDPVAHEPVSRGPSPRDTGQV